jgi:tetratricopeptide (TPR) repeat protein
MWILIASNALGSPATDAIRDTRRALRLDDFAAARAHAHRALDLPGAHDQEAAWLLGLTWQYDGQPQRALVHFDLALDLQPFGAFVEDVQLSRAEALAATGAYRPALKTLRRTRRVRKKRGFRTGEAERLAIDRAEWHLHTRNERRATRRLLAVLDDTDHDLATWQQARARTVLVHRWLDVADVLGATDPASVEGRALLVTRAREQLDETVEHGHDRFILAQLHRLGASFERLGDDLVDAYGTPDDLPTAEREKVENVWVKARSFYDVAARHATRVHWTGAAERYGMAVGFVEAKVDQLDDPG